jgi:hypothetical protein
MPVDPNTFDKYVQAQERARDLGLAPIEVLDRAGVLLTKKRRHDLEVGVMWDLLERLNRQDAGKLMRYYYDRNEGTAAEMFQGILQWVRTVCESKAEGTLGDL